MPVPSFLPSTNARSVRSGGIRNLRATLAATLRQLKKAEPSVVAIDAVLADAIDANTDTELARALADTPNVILGSDIIPGLNRWEDPLPQFRKHAKAVGHVHAAPDPVSRKLPLELIAGRDRKWAMALEAYRLRSGGLAVEESPEALAVGSIVIPARRETSRAMYVRYAPGIPQISVSAKSFPEAHGKVVFIGVTAQTAARDRLMTPLGDMMSGVEIHAQAYETLAHGRFLTTCIAHSCSDGVPGAYDWSGSIFAFLSGSTAYILAFVLLVIAHLTPHIAFATGSIFPYLAPVWAAWLSVFTAAAWQYFVVRRQLQKSESDKARYQQAIHFVTHEMRSPLTAIQGSSELMGRYNLNDAKRKQMADMINAESKRLARMIQTFLDIERLTDGQMEAALRGIRGGRRHRTLPGPRAPSR